MNRIYLDHDATTPADPAVIAEVARCLAAGLGNPSSVHAFGQEARLVLDRARRQVAQAIGGASDEVVFTSGGTESNGLAIRGTLAARPGSRRVVLSAVEHSSVRDTCLRLRDEGLDVAFLPVDGEGRVIVDAVARLAEGAALVAVMLANNEVGTIQPVAEVARIARAAGARMLCDGVQALGRVPVDVAALGVDLLSVSAHKVGGPPGAGALWVRRGVEVVPVFGGGRQETGRRPGTENVPAIAGFGVACGRVPALLAEGPRRQALRDRLERGILSAVPGARRNGPATGRLDNTTSLTVPGVDGDTLVMALDLEGIAVSTGAACSAGRGRPSSVLLALGIDEAEARSTVRLSLGRGNDEAQVDKVIEVFEVLCDRLGSIGAA